MTAAELADALAAVVGSQHVLVDADLTGGYTTDWTGRFAGRTRAVVRPGSTEEVAAIVRWCRQHQVAMVPQGGNTGLVGGSVPLDDEIVLSLRRLDDLGEVDRVAGQVTVGAGATLEAVQRHVAAAGLELAVDLAARGSATVGGMVATNAGGTKVLRHGPMRSQVVGVEAVLGTGDVVAHLGGLLKDNTGYDLAGLLCGSEGTLGVVTAVRLRLVAPAPERTTALLAVASADDAVACFVAARDGSRDLEAAELVFDDGVDLVCRHLGIPPPFPGRPGDSAYLLLEAAAGDDPTERLLAALGPATDRIADTAIATTTSRRADLWRYREAHTEAINALGVPHKLDVTLPLPALARFCADVRTTVQDTAPGARTFLFGHVGDGNVHVNVVGATHDGVDGAVLRLVASRGGSISAEHGIGTAKRDHLHLSRTPQEIGAFRALKRALDPGGVLNPAVLLPLEE